MTRKEYNKCVDDFADALFRFIVKSSHNKALADDIVQFPDFMGKCLRNCMR